MKLVYLIIVLVAASLFVISEVDAHKKHKGHGHGHGHGHHQHHVHHHHYYHSGHGHGWNNRYKREVVDIVQPEGSVGPLLDKLIVSAKLDNGKTLDLIPAVEVKPLNGAVAVEDVVKEAKVVKVDEKVQNVALFAL